ncbi:histone-like nucleoid-structuring protein Lsr2 [Streptomyces sp. NBC_00996]|uniref:Lsr2 family DNA-binding protein n=1 Tax=Streptomyces sp. NBC_00996 TaxID=2903710 RepID=UPI00386461D1|nr:Lsr2 family protein [Streptomyces sp. NBC_00996]
MAGGIFVAKKTASMIWQGRHIVLEQGVTLAREGHPLLDAAGEMFEPVTVHFDLEDSAEPVQAEEDAEPNPAAPGASAKPSAKDIRAWAKANFIDVPARGHIPDDVYEQYQAAHS